MDAITAKGSFCIISFDGATITIERSRMSAQGRSVKHIPLGSVQAIQYTAASNLSPGYIAFTMNGSIERQAQLGHYQQIAKAKRDENAVVFNKRKSAEFDALYQAICAAKGIAA